MSRCGILATALALLFTACADDSTGSDAAIDAAIDASTDSAADAPLPDGGADSSLADTGPDPRCPGPTCPTRIIAVDGQGIRQPCALRRDGELFCVDSAPDESPVFAAAGTFLGGVEIARGAEQTCVLHEAHIVTCFRPGMPPFEVGELFDALDIDTWSNHVCVVRPDRVTCWGDNGSGQIEPGGSTSYPEMHDVPGVTDAVRVATSAEATCALTRDGSVVCWGDDFGASPTPIPRVADGVEITAGEDHFCVTTTSGSVACFGDAEAGTEADAPDGVTDVAEAIALHAETCIRRTDGTVACWGVPMMPGQTEPQPLEPIVGLDDAVLLANHCALRESGTVTCWRARDELVDATGL